VLVAAVRRVGGLQLEPRALLLERCVQRVLVGRGYGRLADGQHAMVGPSRFLVSSISLRCGPASSREERCASADRFSGVEAMLRHAREGDQPGSRRSRLPKLSTGVLIDHIEQLRILPSVVWSNW
jgi:hypothetical protein